MSIIRSCRAVINSFHKDVSRRILFLRESSETKHSCSLFVSVQSVATTRPKSMPNVAYLDCKMLHQSGPITAAFTVWRDSRPVPIGDVTCRFLIINAFSMLVSVTIATVDAFKCLQVRHFLNIFQQTHVYSIRSIYFESYASIFMLACLAVKIRARIYVTINVTRP